MLNADSDATIDVGQLKHHEPWQQVQDNEVDCPSKSPKCLDPSIFQVFALPNTNPIVSFEWKMYHRRDYYQSPTHV